MSLNNSQNKPSPLFLLILSLFYVFFIFLAIGTLLIGDPVTLDPFILGLIAIILCPLPIVLFARGFIERRKNRQWTRGAVAKFVLSIIFLILISQAYIRVAIYQAKCTHQITVSGNLAHCNLSGRDLSRANLSNVNLEAAILEGANLQQINLANANLNGASLSHANLTNAILTDSNLIGASLVGADLTNATLTGSDLTGASLVSADLTNARLTRTNLTRTQLMGAILNNATLDAAIIKDTKFVDYTGEVIGLTDDMLTSAFNVPLDLLPNVLREKSIKLESNETMEKNLAGACHGLKVSNAGDYIADKAFHPIVIIYTADDDRGNNFFNGQPDVSEWSPPASRFTQLVGCVEKKKMSIESCSYGSGGSVTIWRYQYQLQIKLIVANSASVIENNMFSGTLPEKCPKYKSTSDGDIYGGDINFADAKSWMAGFVNPP